MWVSSSGLYVCFSKLFHSKRMTDSSFYISRWSLWTGRLPGRFSCGQSTSKQIQEPRGFQVEGWRCVWSLVISSLSLLWRFRISSYHLLGPIILTEHALWADDSLLSRGQRWLLARGQKFQLPNSVYTGQRKGAQLCRGTASFSLTRPLMTAPHPSSYCPRSRSCLLGPPGEGMCSVLGPGPTVFSTLSHQFIYLLFLFQKYLKTSGLLMTLFLVSYAVISFSSKNLFCYFDGDVGGRRGKPMS